MVDRIVQLTNVVFVVAYGLVFRWYWTARKQQNNSGSGSGGSNTSTTTTTTDRLERCILLTILLGLAELLFRTLTGTSRRVTATGAEIFFFGMTMMAAVLANTLARGLLVALSLGAGAGAASSASFVPVSNNARGLTINMILTSLYFVSASMRDLLALLLGARFMKREGIMTATPTPSERRLERVIVAHEVIVLILDAIFAVWICIALSRTVKLFRRVVAATSSSSSSATTLGGGNEQRQRGTAATAELRRHSTLQRCFWIALALQATSALFMADVLTSQSHHHSLRHDSIDIHVSYFVARFNFLFLVTVVAVLWKPGGSAAGGYYAPPIPFLSGDDDSGGAGTASPFSALLSTTPYVPVQQTEDNNYNGPNDLELSYTPPAAILGDNNDNTNGMMANNNTANNTPINNLNRN